MTDREPEAPLLDDEEDDEESLLAPPRPTLRAEVPRFPPSPTPPRPQSPSQPAGSSPPPATPSSPASTEPPPDPPAPAPAAQMVPPKDLQDAISEATAIGFTLAGQGVGILYSRARPGTDPSRWIPTVEERARVTGPAGRIARRHIRGDVESADTVDACLIAAGLGSFVLRAAFDKETPDAPVA